MDYNTQISEKEDSLFKPTLFKLEFAEDKLHAQALLGRPETKVINQIEGQLLELMKLRNVGKNASESEWRVLASEYVNSTSGNLDGYGYWVHYPWSGEMVRLLSEPDFIDVRTDRNRLKITREEQSILSKKRVGIVGLSVGRAIATTIALERICGEIRLADFDTIELSNLNRLGAPLRDLGLHKGVSAARAIAENDPFLRVELFTEGLTPDNAEAFMNGSEKLDLVIDECDSIEMKIKLREQAKKFEIPVIMETSDRGMLDVERFDLDGEAPIFHGRLSSHDVGNYQSLSPQQKWEVLMALVDFEKLSDRARLSMSKIGTEISTWPQLASSVVMGGGTTTEVARQLLLGNEVQSGRYYIDVNQIIGSQK